MFYASFLKLANEKIPIIKIPKKYVKGFFIYNVEKFLNKQNIDG